jgi:large subunit ribosomal protein L1
MLRRLLPVCQLNVARQAIRPLFLSATDEAARKGTREKARKKKVKVEIKKVGFIPHNLRKKYKWKFFVSKLLIFLMVFCFRIKVEQNKHADDSWKQLPGRDDAWVGKYYQRVVWPFEDAIKCHRETHHPTMYNVPNAPVIAHIEMNMVGDKPSRLVDNFSRMAPIDFKFDHGEERSILVFAKGNDNIELAKNSGGTLVGDAGLVKSIQNGDLSLHDYQFIIAHTNILAEIVPLRGLMKRRFPNPKNGTLGTNIEEMIQKFLNGITYRVTRDENQPDYAIISPQFGTLDMDVKQLESNLTSLLNDINSMRPKREGKFITRVRIECPPSHEMLKINPFLYVPEEQVFTKRGPASAKSSSFADDETLDEDDDDNEKEEKEKKEAIN